MACTGHLCPNNLQNCHPMPPHCDSRSHKSKENYDKDGKTTRENKMQHSGVSMHGKYHKYKIKWTRYKSPDVQVGLSMCRGVTHHVVAITNGKNELLKIKASNIFCEDIGTDVL